MRIAVIALAPGAAAERAAAQHRERGGLPPSEVEVHIHTAGPVPARRRAALDAPGVDLVAWVEDTGDPQPGWAHAAHARFRDEPDLLALSGPVRGQGLDARGWGWLVHDYGPWLEATDGDQTTLPGHLLVVRRSAALEVLGDDAPREDVLLPRLAARGRLALDTRLTTVLRRPPASGLLAAQVGHARGWAGRARGQWPWAARAARVAGWPLVAALRARRAVSALPEHVPPGSAAHAAALSTAWAFGEGLGALLGPPPSEEFWT